MMKTWSLLFAAAAAAATMAVQQPAAAAFKLPELFNFGGGQTTKSSIHENEEPSTTYWDYDTEQAAEYSGPVFVIREVISDDDDGSSRVMYDAFVTTAGIEEVKLPDKDVNKINGPKNLFKNNSTVTGHKKPSNNGTASAAAGHKKPSNNGTASAAAGHKKPSNNGTASGGHTKPSNNGTASGGHTKPSSNGTASGGHTKPSNNGTASGGHTKPFNNGTADHKKKPSVNGTAENGKPSGNATATTAKEDPNLFGVLVTHQSVAQFKLPGSLRVNVSLSALLEASASRMPWVLVLRRNQSVQFSVNRATPAPPKAETARQRRRLYADFSGHRFPGDDDYDGAREYVVRYRQPTTVRRKWSSNDVVVSAVSAAGEFTSGRAQERGDRKMVLSDG